MGYKKLITQFSEEVGGEIVQGKWGAGPYLIFNYKGFKLVYDYHVISTGQTTIVYSRLRAYMRSQSPFTLKVSKEGTFAKLGKMLGSQDIQIGDEFFDDHYIVKSNDDYLARKVLNNYEVKRRFSFKHSFNFAITDKDSMGIKKTENEKGLTFYTTHHVKHHVELQNLIELFHSTIDVLLELNIITEGQTEGILYK